MKDIDKELDTKIRDTLDQMMIASQNAIVGYSNGDWFEEAVNEIQQLINQARIDELEKAEPNAERTYPECDGILDYIDDRLKELKGNK